MVVVDEEVDACEVAGADGIEERGGVVLEGFGKAVGERGVDGVFGVVADVLGLVVVGGVTFLAGCRFDFDHGKGVGVAWGLEVFRRILCWSEAPTYVLAMGAAVEGVGNYATRPRNLAGGGRGRERLQTAYRAPETAVEKALALLWEKTLGIQPIGIDDDFVELGGDSIEAIQIQHAIHRDFDLRIKNTEFLAGPTIAALAALIAARSEVGAVAVPA